MLARFMGRPPPTDKQLIDDGYKELDCGDSATAAAAAGSSRGRKSSRIAPLVDGSAPTGAAEPEASCAGALRLFECLVECGHLSPAAIAVAEEELRRQASASGTTYVSRQPSAASLSSKPRAKKARGPGVGIGGGTVACLLRRRTRHRPPTLMLPPALEALTRRPQEQQEQRLLPREPLEVELPRSAPPPP